MKSPTPDEVKKRRQKLGLGYADAANIIGRSSRSWRFYEDGTVEMPAGLWELFKIKTENKS